MARPGQVGSQVSPSVIDQIKIRQKTVGATNKSKEQQLFLNSNAAWIKLRSAVNELTPEGYAKVEQAILSRETSYTLSTTATKAQDFILLGGTRSSTADGLGQNRAGISLQGGVYDTTKAYQNFNGEYGLGFRPMPGITGLNVSSKNPYGTLLTAQVDFKVFSLEDLEICELLFFRPGYTALLEWGHTVYLDRSGNLIQTTSTGLTDDEFFLPRNQQYIDERITKRREEAVGNYDGMYGYITNFSFSLNEDGSYDCQLKIVSRGVILEGLQPGNVTDHAKETEEEEESKEDKNKSIFHFIFHFLQKNAKTGKNSFIETLESRSKDKKVCKEVIALCKDAGVDFEFFTMKTEIEDPDGWFDDGIKVLYLHLGDFLKLVNVFNSLSSPKKKGVKRREDDIFLVEPGNKYATYPDHFSVDPMIAHPTAKPQGKLGSNERLNSIFAWLLGLSLTENKAISQLYIGDNGKGLHYDWQKHVRGKKEVYGGTDDVLSIPVSHYAIIKALDNILTGPQSDNISIFDALEEILDNISAALGGINDLDLYYNHEVQKYEVIDRNHSVPGNLPVINVSGVNSTVYDLKISSTISNNVATMVAIAAQGNSGDPKKNLDTLMEWNRGAIDRHIPIKTVSTIERDDDARKAKREYLKNIIKVYQQFNNRSIFIDQVYNTELVERLRSQSNQWIADAFKKSNYTQGLPAQGTVPVELELTMLGIYGFVPGTTFKINKGLLPSKYDQWCYIVTGLNHTIDMSGWKTKIKTQFFPAREPQPTQIPGVEPSKFERNQQQAVTGTDDFQVAESVLNDDPAPEINPKKIGATYYSSSPVAQTLLASGQQNGLLTQTNSNVLVFIGETRGANRLYINPATGAPEYMLHPAAAKAWYKWRDEMLSRGINYSVSSAYRSVQHQSNLGSGKTVAKPGSSPHGWGGAIDFRNLYAIVGGSGNPQVNLNGRKTEIYRDMASIGAKYGWYNPWRLSDVAGTDEIWHFEYWGAV